MKSLLQFLMFTLALNLNAQKGRLLTGIEAGANIAANPPFNTLSGQGGIVGEYYFAKQWSVVGKIKYHQANINKSSGGYSSSSAGMGFNLFGSPPRDVSYQSQNILIPISIKWNYRIFRNLYGSVDMGPYLNFTLNSKYTANNVDVHDRKIFIGFNIGAGVHYQLQNGNSLFANYDFYRGTEIALLESFIFNNYARAGNHHFSVGYLWQLK